MRRLRLIAALAVIAALAAYPTNRGFADTSSTPITQTATHPDAAVFWIGQANGVTSCNTTGQTAAQDTVTITPPSNMVVHLTNVILQVSTNATGATAVPTIAIGGVSSNGGAAPFLSAATTLATTGYHIDMNIPFPAGGLLGTGPGVAVTLTPSATLNANAILCMSAIGYFNQN